MFVLQATEVVIYQARPEVLGSRHRYEQRQREDSKVAKLSAWLRTWLRVALDRKG